MRIVISAEEVSDTTSEQVAKGNVLDLNLICQKKDEENKLENKSDVNKFTCLGCQLALVKLIKKLLVLVPKNILNQES